MFMRLCLLVLSLAVAALAHLPSGAQAKGNALSVFPTSGEIHTTIAISSDYWTPDVEVTVVAGFVDSRDEAPAVFSGPVAVQRSSSSGRVQVQVRVEDAPGLIIPSRPGFIVLRATSGGAEPRTADAEFVLVVDGKRPNGAGEINLTIKAREGTVPGATYFGWRRAGDPSFFTPYSEIPIPFSVKIDALIDGDWQIAVITESGSQLVGEGTVEELDAPFCIGVDICSLRHLVAKRVTIRNGQPIDTTVLIGQSTIGHQLPAAGFASQRQGGARYLWRAALLASLGAFFVIGGSSRRVRWGARTLPPSHPQHD